MSEDDCQDSGDGVAMAVLHERGRAAAPIFFTGSTVMRCLLLVSGVAPRQAFEGARGGGGGAALKNGIVKIDLCMYELVSIICTRASMHTSS